MLSDSGTPVTPGAPTTSAVPDAPAVLTLRDAAFGYAERTMVAGVDLSVAQGEALALLGPNGSGKSTLVKGLLGLARHTEGEVDLFGIPLARFTDRHRVGYVPQRHTLSGTVRASVGEIVACGLLAGRRVGWRISRADRAVIADSLDLVGLAHRARDDVATLSGGQHRRVLIARALAARPDLLVMDEPTAGMDASSQGVLAHVLRRLRTERHLTLLMVTHELAAMTDVFTRVAVLDAGRLVHVGPVDDEAAEGVTGGAPGEASRWHTGGSHWHTGDGHHHDDEGHTAPRSAVATDFRRTDG